MQIGSCPDSFPTAPVPSVTAAHNVFTQLELDEEERHNSQNMTWTMIDFATKIKLAHACSQRGHHVRLADVSEMEAFCLNRVVTTTSVKAAPEKQTWTRCRWQLHERSATKSVVQQLPSANIHIGSPADKTRVSSNSLDHP